MKGLIQSTAFPAVGTQEGKYMKLKVFLDLIGCFIHLIRGKMQSLAVTVEFPSSLEQRVG